MNPALQRARKRQMVIFLLTCSGMVLLLGRLYYWQILQAHSGYNLAQLANDEHTQNVYLDAPRGIIYDSQGHILATNIVRDDVYVEPHQFAIDHSTNAQEDLNALIQGLHQVLPQVAVSDLQADFNTDMGAIRVAVRIDPAQSHALLQLRLPDVFLSPRTWRVYPDNTLAAQILGYVTQNDGANTGVYGIEGQDNPLLVGQAGSVTTETDLQGNPLTVAGGNQEPVNGANLTLTIDSSVEYMVESMLAKTVQDEQAQSGAVVVLNARTGAVVAMAGYPTFDPNNYGAYYNQTGCLHTEQVYFNPVLYCAYEPGSTMKAVTMAAALDQGLITPDTSLQDNGCITYNDAPTVCNWQNTAYGTETMTQVLIHSANVGASYVAHNILGAQRYYPYLARFGFGQPVGIDGPEASGNYRVPCGYGWSPCSQQWTMSDLTRQAFGQSIEATPLQVAQAYQAIANGGVMMQPYLVAAVDKNGQVTKTQPTPERRVISQEAAQLLTEMLTQAAFYGTGQLALVPGYSVAAKTGTATTQGISDDQTEASVAGFIPASNPQFVILVKLDRPQKSIFGGTVAAPLWGQIAQQLMWYYAVPPDLKQ